MKEIIHRAKDEYSGEWVFGSLVTDNKDIFEIWTPKTQEDWKLKFKRHEIIPGTRGQYWRTANNQKLFDGDIFDVIINGEVCARKVVKYNEVEACFCIANSDELVIEQQSWMKIWESPSSSWWAEYGKDIKIVGNIHDNSELLKQD